MCICLSVSEQARVVSDIYYKERKKETENKGGYLLLKRGKLSSSNKREESLTEAKKSIVKTQGEKKKHLIHQYINCKHISHFYGFFSKKSTK